MVCNDLPVCGKAGWLSCIYISAGVLITLIVPNKSSPVSVSENVKWGASKSI